MRTHPRYSTAIMTAQCCAVAHKASGRAAQHREGMAPRPQTRAQPGWGSTPARKGRGKRDSLIRDCPSRLAWTPLSAPPSLLAALAHTLIISASWRSRYAPSHSLQLVFRPLINWCMSSATCSRPRQAQRPGHYHDSLYRNWRAIANRLGSKMMQ